VLVNKLKVSVAVGLLSTTLVGIALTGGPVSASSANCSTATSAAACGGMSKLVAAAKKEGTLNVITLPTNWANYGTIIKDFSKKYGIKVNSYNPDGSSQDEINAVVQDKGRAQAPDVLDVGTSYATSNLSLLAPYKVATWSSIPSQLKDPKGRWFDDYGGYMSIGCNSKVVSVCPTSFKQLLNPMYKNEVGINGDPTQASAAFSAVFAASLANGGSLSNIQPGIDFFAQLNKVGNYVPGGSAATAASGTTPILIWWDYLQSAVKQTLPSWKVNIPTDSSYAAYYTQAINASAPHPAAARLWEEFLYSTQGQNLWLQGNARPVELPMLVKKNLANKTWLGELPAAPAGATTYPTLAQLATAKSVVAANWSAAISG
jgi:putative spermidine/putrescine transport system substrate-binding protein